MQGARDLLGSERGAFCVVLLLAATALVVLGKLDGSAWLEFMKYLAVTLVASKTVTSALETYSAKPVTVP